jgi:hypothetical protein
MKVNRLTWLKIVGLTMTMVFTLVSCNFPLSSGTPNDDTGEKAVQQTVLALQQTVAAYQAQPVVPTATLEPVTAQEPTTQALPLPTTEVTAVIVHVVTPGDPPGNRESGMTDPNTSAYANAAKTMAGENFSMGLFERPFNSGKMDQYFPDLDILQGSLNRVEPWVYVWIRVQDTQPGGVLPGSYGAEFDLNSDGRGDVFVFVKNPTAQWSVDGVQVWQDTNKDVGGGIPVEADGKNTGDGYDAVIFNSGVGSDPDAAWGRISPSDPRTVQIAFKYALINNDPTFMWGAWAKTEFDPAMFDYNDHYTITEAGSPLTYQVPYYPLKAFAEVDNTCRWALGYKPSGSEPGVCPVPATPTPTASPGSISGYAWNDWNGNLVMQPGEPKLPGAKIQLNRGSCGSGGENIGTKTTGSDGKYYFGGITAGSYCVSVAGNPPGGYVPVGASSQNITVSPGGSAGANFPFWIIIY